MTIGGKGKGRGAKHVSETLNDGREARAHAAAKPTRRPLPDWMQNPQLLPRKPPERKREIDE